MHESKHFISSIMNLLHHETTEMHYEVATNNRSFQRSCEIFLYIVYVIQTTDDAE